MESDARSSKELGTFTAGIYAKTKGHQAVKSGEADFKMWYMRGNHTFLLLPFDAVRALKQLENEFEKGNTGGCLFVRFDEIQNAPPFDENEYDLNAATKWRDFEEPASDWLKKMCAIREKINDYSI